LAQALQYWTKPKGDTAWRRNAPGFQGPLLKEPLNPQGENAMNKKALLMSAAVGGLVAMGALSTSALAADDAATEKCYGVAKAGKNDCAGKAHACAGQSTKDAQASEWLKLPKGTCEKLVNGSTAAKM
jgi:uncharacterized membrane protein